jgi:hypothetical protein
MNFCRVPNESTAPLAAGMASGAACAPFCGDTANFQCALVEVDAQELVRCWVLCTGRRPAGLVAESEGGQRDLSAYLGEVAYLEAASVAAFVGLGRELRHHGAPRPLLRATVRAARDEVRHARVMGALARRHGVAQRKARVKAPPAVRTLAEIAVENAVEGCVRETYGALVATYQARTAGDAALRAAMRGIAKDETAHAALAWRIAAWIDRRLTPAERNQVSEARREAVEQLARGVARGAAEPSVQRLAGIPSPTQAVRMMTEMRDVLWRA